MYPATAHTFFIALNRLVLNRLVLCVCVAIMAPKAVVASVRVRKWHRDVRWVLKRET